MIGDPSRLRLIRKAAAGFIFEENANLNIVSVPRSCHKLSSGTKKNVRTALVNFVKIPESFDRCCKRF